MPSYNILAELGSDDDNSKDEVWHDVQRRGKPAPAPVIQSKRPTHAPTGQGTTRASPRDDSPPYQKPPSQPRHNTHDDTGKPVAEDYYRAFQKCFRDASGDVVLKFHKTNVVTVRPNGDVQLYTNNYFTYTTLCSMNDALQFIDMKLTVKGDVKDPDNWLVTVTGGPSYAFHDNMILKARHAEDRNRCDEVLNGMHALLESTEILSQDPSARERKSTGNTKLHTVQARAPLMMYTASTGGGGSGGGGDTAAAAAPPPPPTIVSTNVATAPPPLVKGSAWAATGSLAARLAADAPKTAAPTTPPSSSDFPPLAGKPGAAAPAAAGTSLATTSTTAAAAPRPTPTPVVAPTAPQPAASATPAPASATLAPQHLATSSSGSTHTAPQTPPSTHQSTGAATSKRTPKAPYYSSAVVFSEDGLVEEQAHATLDSSPSPAPAATVPLASLSQPSFTPAPITYATPALVSYSAPAAAPVTYAVPAPAPQPAPVPVNIAPTAPAPTPLFSHLPDSLDEVFAAPPPPHHHYPAPQQPTYAAPAPIMHAAPPAPPPTALPSNGNSFFSNAFMAGPANPATAAVSQLYQQQAAEWDNGLGAGDDDDTKCVVCMHYKCNTILIPCSHVILCRVCADHVVNLTPGSAGECPVCRTPVELVLDVR